MRYFADRRVARYVKPLLAEKLRSIFATAETVPIVEHVTGCANPKDDKFLELAINGNADAIIAGNRHLLTLRVFRGIPIETPATFGRAYMRER